MPSSATAAACPMRSKNASPNSDDEDAENTSAATQQELAETQHADLGADDYEADDDTSVLDEELLGTEAFAISVVVCKLANMLHLVGIDLQPCFAFNSSAADNSSAESETESLEPTPSEIRLVPSLFAGRTGTVFFDYPEALGIGSRCDAGCVTEQLGQRSLTFKTHWERNSVKNAFSRKAVAEQEGQVRRTVFCTYKVQNNPGAYKNSQQSEQQYSVHHNLANKHALALLTSWSSLTLPSCGDSDCHMTCTKLASSCYSAMCITLLTFNRLMSTIGHMRRVTPMGPQAYDFLPYGYMLPRERRAWLKAVQ
eukprot:3824-Heterococcus_DN1.PRE.1